jgi:hypothetical protein
MGGVWRRILLGFHTIMLAAARATRSQNHARPATAEFNPEQIKRDFPRREAKNVPANENAPN